METMNQWEETEEEGGALRGRTLAQQRSTDANDATTGDFIFSSESSSEEDQSLNQEEEESSWGRPRNGTFISDKNGGTESESDEISQNNGGNVDLLTSKKNPGDQIPELDVIKVDTVSCQKNDVTNHQDEDTMNGVEELPGFGSSPSKQSIVQNGHYNSLSNGTTDHGNGIAKTREIGAQGASELDLERVYQKPAAHDFYCPHCNTCITKVIIRGRESEITPPAAEPAPPEPVDPFRCTSCFSFLIPAGNWFFPKLVPKDEESHTEQGTNIRIDENGVPVPSHDSNRRLQDQHSKTVLVNKNDVPNEFAGASVDAIAISTTPSQSVGVEFEGSSQKLNGTLYGQKPTTPAQSVAVEVEVPSEELNGTLYGKKPTTPAQSVGVEFEVPSQEFNGTLYGQKPTTPAQSVGVEFEAPSHKSNETLYGKQFTISAQSVGVEFAAPSNALDETLYGQKPTMSAQSVGVEFSVPSNDLNVTFYGPKPTVSAQSDGGSSKDASIHETSVFGEHVEAGVGFAGRAKPSENNYESSVGVQVLTSAHDSNGTLNNQNPSALGHSVGVSVHVTNKPTSSEIDVVAISQDAPQRGDAVAPGGNRLDCSSGETYAGKTEPRESTTVTITQPDPATIPEQGDTKSLEILKSIVYGGLTEAITSLGIVTSAASADTATLNIVALALANLVGGLFVLGHHLWELKSDQSRVPSSETGEQVDRYQKVLGKRENFFLHSSVAVLSFLVFGLVPPLVYGFSFRQSNDRDLKMAAVASASLVCIIVLAIGKAHNHKPPKYIKNLLYYIAIGIGVGGVSFLAGDLIDKLIEKLGWFASSASGTLFLPTAGVVNPALESY